MTKVDVTIRADYRRDNTFYAGIVQADCLDNRMVKNSTDLVEVVETILRYVQQNSVANPEYDISCSQTGTPREDLDRRVRDLFNNPFVKKRAQDRIRDSA